ncbi:hypothetical protein Q4E40_01340 [Pontibacter sp. BT731]|uniref:hypothetical protein n=1 Tax=Pontibacter coccineus TaxID=3063328 RepID=UPI0026E3FEDD|nr:hypothetical protein [Pontibacter sp. BT731]MDO6388750.1 hypothetical protein [Pontibacter sp. BT731]
MKLTGNILNIKNKRDDRNADVSIEVDKIEYVTYKKDGKYYQPFNVEVELEESLVITGDQLARKSEKHLQEGEYDFDVYDKAEAEYVLNEDKFLSVLLAYDEFEQEHVLSSVEYTVTLSNEEFKVLKEEQHKLRQSRKGTGKKKK